MPYGALDLQGPSISPKSLHPNPFQKIFFFKTATGVPTDFEIFVSGVHGELGALALSNALLPGCHLLMSILR